MLIERPKPEHPARKMPDNPKPKLRAEHLPVFRVHFKDLESYIRRVFGFEYDYLLAAGVAASMSVDYRVTGELTTGEMQRGAEQLRNGRRGRNVLLILNTLAHDRYIPTGLYTISTAIIADPVAVYTELLQRTRNPDHPHCVQFREKHRGNSVFVERATILDQAAREQAK